MLRAVTDPTPRGKSSGSWWSPGPETSLFLTSPGQPVLCPATLVFWLNLGQTGALPCPECSHSLYSLFLQVSSLLDESRLHYSCPGESRTSLRPGTRCSPGMLLSSWLCHLPPHHGLLAHGHPTLHQALDLLCSQMCHKSPEQDVAQSVHAQSPESYPSTVYAVVLHVCNPSSR